MKITEQVINIMIEFYRRQYILNDGTVQKLGNCAYPSEMKKTKELGLVKPLNGVETARVLNWYSLTEKGALLLNTFIEKGLSIEDFDGFDMVNQSVRNEISEIRSSA